MKRIVNVQKVIDKSNGPLTPSATILFDAIKEEANQCKVVFGGYKYQVSGPFDDQCVVDVVSKNCTCRKWELTGMPCKHAVAAIWDMEMNNLHPGSPESWVHESYWLSTWKNVYGYKINPVNGRNMWFKSQCPSTLIPPKHMTQVGRPTKKRKMSAGELSEKMAKDGKLSRLGKTVTCGKCKKQGHNKKSCEK